MGYAEADEEMKIEGLKTVGELTPLGKMVKGHKPADSVEKLFVVRDCRC